jgi:hypothetical protein
MTPTCRLYICNTLLPPSQLKHVRPTARHLPIPQTRPQPWQLPAAEAPASDLHRGFGAACCLQLLLLLLEAVRLAVLPGDLHSDLTGLKKANLTSTLPAPYCVVYARGATRGPLQGTYQGQQGGKAG